MSGAGIVIVGILAILLTGLMVTRKYLLERRAETRRWAARKAALSQLRLSKMLRYLGADIDQYVRRVPFIEIQEAINTCERCRQAERCDRCLRDGRRMDPHFCPNYDRLIEHSKILAN